MKFYIFDLGQKLSYAKVKLVLSQDKIFFTNLQLFAVMWRLEINCNTKYDEYV